MNILSNARFNPDLPAYVYLYSPYNFNNYPMTLPGTRVVFHEKPGNRMSWGHRGTACWYIVPPLDHYRFLLILMYDFYQVVHYLFDLDYDSNVYDIPYLGWFGTGFQFFF